MIQTETPYSIIRIEDDTISISPMNKEKLLRMQSKHIIERTLAEFTNNDKQIVKCLRFNEYMVCPLNDARLNAEQQQIFEKIAHFFNEGMLNFKAFNNLELFKLYETLCAAFGETTVAYTTIAQLETRGIYPRNAKGEPDLLQITRIFKNLPINAHEYILATQATDHYRIAPPNEVRKFLSTFIKKQIERYT